MMSSSESRAVSMISGVLIVPASQIPGDLNPIHARQHYIQKDDVEIGAGGDVERGPPSKAAMTE